jgi:acyl-coenzyme A thioesterase PaaI-like protein
MRPWLLRHLMNIWGPFRSAGIVVTALAEDWSHARVVLKEAHLNRNYVGTHFGGSLFAMTDPFYMLMLLHRLGKGYRVWDSAASIEYLTPGRGTVSADFLLDDPTVDRIHRSAASGEAVFPEFDVDIRDAGGTVVARVHKTIYVRRKPTTDGDRTAARPTVDC